MVGEAKQEMGEFIQTNRVFYPTNEVDFKLIVQMARKENNPKILSGLNKNEIYKAKQFLRKLNEPLFSRWLSLNTVNGKFEKPSTIKTKFSYPSSLDPLINTTLQTLVDEFLYYLEEKYYAVIEFQKSSIIIHSFYKIDLSSIFSEFIKNRYDDTKLLYRWTLIKNIYNLQEFPLIIPPPLEIKKVILDNKLSLEVEEAKVGFGDDAKDYCMFCGRVGNNYSVVTGFADFSSQRPQKGYTTTSPKICPICVFSIYVSVVRTSQGTGQQQKDLVVLKTMKKEEPFDYIFNRLLGISTGDYISITNMLQKENSYGKSALTYISASTLPLQVLVDEEFNIKNLSTNQFLDINKCIVIKIFESILGHGKFWHPDDEQEYKKAHYAILRGNYFSLFKHIGVLLQNKGRQGRLVLDNGIYQLLKYEVIKMEDRPDIIFGTALLVDTFIPNSDREDIKTETRKVAFYLEKPEEVLLRLRQINKEKDYATLEMDFTNKAQYKLLKDLLIKIHEEEGYGNFEKEQQERKQIIEKIANFKYGEGERLFLRFDDLLKVYIYIQKILSQKYGNNPKKLEKEYSDLIGRIKYALVARRPELIQRGE
ncbi:hypothetical protein Mtc_1189 [Methanocella conradii HZ254]|uniref:Uncharacterized protein n=1 Tax=Methanocella conradii (strain DSM 24694 / JCM 17849 / CGMCC 1.5162 / HZ254) TaxID=1041930 RepID=H8I8N8_METCZ|nr:hypothetical protein [Methanocella conradii]AFC99942.1 hypothetical protein Mtc_1189 [Methanocella conradii HZ254]